MSIVDEDVEIPLAAEPGRRPHESVVLLRKRADLIQRQIWYRGLERVEHGPEDTPESFSVRSVGSTHEREPRSPGVVR